jgi:hypothetical protein
MLDRPSKTPTINNRKDKMPYETNSLGYKLTFEGPKTVEEYDQKAGRVGACLEDAVDNTIYRGTLPEWQDEFARKVAERTGVERGTDNAATERARSRSKDPAKVNDVPEKVKAYVQRVTAGMSEQEKNNLAVLAQEVANGIYVDPSPSKRAKGPGKDLLAKADSLLTLPEDQLQTKIDKYLSRVEGFELETDENDKPERNSLARLIGRYLDILLSES